MKKNNVINWILNFIITILLIYLVVSWFFIGRAKISGRSMEPTFHDKDKVLFYHNPDPIKRFDILAIHLDKSYLGNRYQEDIIKRAVGLPGETVELKDGHLFVNNKEVKQNFTHNDDHSSKNWGKLKNGEYAVLGDNRPNSLDSRFVGTINIKDIFGKIFTKSWF